MNNQYYQGGYGHPPPQGGFGGPPHQGYGGPPQHPQGGYGGPPGPPHGYGAPPPHQGFPPGPPPGQQGYGPPQGYGAPQGYQHGPPPGPPHSPGFQQGGPSAPHYQQQQSGPAAYPSPGYTPGQLAPMDMGPAADQLRAAMKGMGTNEKKLIEVLTSLDPLQVESVRQAFAARHHRSLAPDIESETSGYFRDGLVALARGPLEQDVHNLDDAIRGAGTKEAVLNDVLLSRSNADIHAIKAAYHRKHNRSLESDVRNDLSMKTARLFDMVLQGNRNEESSPVYPQQTDQDVQALYHATEGKTGNDALNVCAILSNRSDGQLRAISHAYQHKFRRPLVDVLKSEFSGHMEDALVFILSAAEDRAKHDATLLEQTMKGPGTKDNLLVNRVIRIHWSRERMSQAKAAFKHFYHKDLASRIQGDTSGHYERLMVACVNSA